MNVEGVVDDKVAVPHHRKVNREVTDVTALVVVLQQGNRDVTSVRNFPFRTNPDWKSAEIWSAFA